MSDMKLAARRALCPGLVLLIHSPKQSRQTGITVKCNMRSVGADPVTGETDVACRGNRIE